MQMKERRQIKAWTRLQAEIQSVPHIFVFGTNRRWRSVFHWGWANRNRPGRRGPLLPLDPWDPTNRAQGSFSLTVHHGEGGELLHCEQWIVSFEVWRRRTIKLLNYQVFKLSHLIWWLHNFALRNSTEGATPVVIFETERSLLPKISGLYRRVIF